MLLRHKHSSATRNADGACAVDDTDWLKTAAIICVSIDHFGYFFVEDSSWWSVFGRLAAPTFFFLIGYARTRSVPLYWIWLGIGLTVLDSWNADWAWVAPNILLSLAFCRFARPRAESLVERYGWAAFVVLTCGLVAVLPIAAKFVDYGAEGWLWALFGLYQRRYVERRRATQLAGASSPGLTKIVACVVAAVIYIWQEQAEFSFHRINFAVFVVELAALSVFLCVFRRGPSRVQPSERTAKIVCFIGRHTLELYAIPLAGAELLVQLAPGLAR
jgi:hypothetical protein